MRGVICRRHVLAHPVVTIQSFGWEVFFRVLTAGPDRTFLSIIAPTLDHSTAPPAVSTFIERCVSLEVRAGEIYRRLALRFEDSPQLAGFFETLAMHEQGHAELLEFCRGLAADSCWREEEVAGWRGVLPRLEKRMSEVEDGLDRLAGPMEALKMVIEIEGSEINNLFRGVVEATDSEFVRTFQAFQNAEKEHLDFICKEIPLLDPTFTDACDELRARTHETGHTH